MGPLPASVYWRRRCVAMAATAGAFILLGGLVAGAATPAEAPGVDPASMTTAEGPSFQTPQEPSQLVSAPVPALPTVAAPPTVAEPAGAPVPGPPASAPVEAAVPPCTNSMIATAAEIDRAEHRVGQQPVLRLVITNTSTQPCTRDLDPARQEVVVWSEDLKTRLWSSNDCRNESTVDQRTLLPNQLLGFRVTWAGRTSTPGCAEQRTVVPAGTYQVMTRVDDVISPPTQFRRLP